MNKKIILFTVLTVSTLSLAEDKVQISTTNIKEAKKSFSAKKYKIVEEKTAKSRLPKLEQRNLILKKAGLFYLLSEKDELYIDRLYYFAKKLSSEKLISRYSKIDKEKLLKLKELAK